MEQYINSHDLIPPEFRAPLPRMDESKEITDEASRIQPPDQRGGYDFDAGPRQRDGNNRYHQPKLKAKRKAKLAKASRKRNRK